jgi:hypothetical protein
VSDIDVLQLAVADVGPDFFSSDMQTGCGFGQRQQPTGHHGLLLAAAGLRFGGPFGGTDSKAVNKSDQPSLGICDH